MPIQLLEPRRLLSAVFDSTARIVTVNGTPADDSINVEWERPAGQGITVRVVLNGVLSQWTDVADAPLRVLVSAGDGADVVRVHPNDEFVDFIAGPSAEI